jgi:glycosyltransferase involved in cell wall biosynthesis
VTQDGRIRVARVITRLNVGGPSFQALLLTEKLDPRRFETRLFAGTTERGEAEILDLRPELGARPRVIPGLRREVAPLDDIRALATIVRELRAFHPHIVHTHMAKAGLLGRIAARIAGVPAVVHTFHGNVLSGYFDPVRARVFLALEQLLGRASTRIIAISERQRREIEKLGIARAPKLVQLPLGLDLGPFLAARRGALRRELGFGEETQLVGIVARLVPIKAVDAFIDAAALVAREVPTAQFVVVGDGELRGTLERLASDRGLGGRIHFLGWRADVAAVYADLDVVVLTSRNEGTPVTLIEALAARRAVVATNVGGVPDLIQPEEQGLLVPVGDARAVARAVGELLREPERRAILGAAGRERVYPAYDASTLVARIEALYTELIPAPAMKAEATR